MARYAPSPTRKVATQLRIAKRNLLAIKELYPNLPEKGFLAQLGGAIQNIEVCESRWRIFVSSLGKGELK